MFLSVLGQFYRFYIIIFIFISNIALFDKEGWWLVVGLSEIEILFSVLCICQYIVSPVTGHRDPSGWAEF